MNPIVVGYDGSPGADQALGLVRNLRLPPGTVVRAITAVPPASQLRSAWGRLIVGEASVLARELSDQAEAGLDRARQMLLEAGVTAETAVATGRPSVALVDEARRARASLVVVGSRGHGPIKSALVGSVAAEVVDSAPCPVLVARSEAVAGVLFATDGSDDAEAAERFLASLPIAREVPVRVLSVAPAIRPWATGLAPTYHGPGPEAQAAYEEYARQAHGEFAASSMARLSAQGINCDTQVRLGDPASEVVFAATEFGADLIVVGSRGQTGLHRLVLGSVARRVLNGSSASVLIVRSGADGPATDSAPG